MIKIDFEDSLNFFPKQAILVCQYKEFQLPDRGIHK